MSSVSVSTIPTASNANTQTAEAMRHAGVNFQQSAEGFSGMGPKDDLHLPEMRAVPHEIPADFKRAMALIKLDNPAETTRPFKTLANVAYQVAFDKQNYEYREIIDDGGNKKVKFRPVINRMNGGYFFNNNGDLVVKGIETVPFDVVACQKPPVPVASASPCDKPSFLTKLDCKTTLRLVFAVIALIIFLILLGLFLWWIGKKIYRKIFKCDKEKKPVYTG